MHAITLTTLSGTKSPSSFHWRQVGGWNARDGRTYLFTKLPMTGTSTYGSKRMKKILGHLGSVGAAVGLAAAGLVAVAPIAYAGEVACQGTKQVVDSSDAADAIKLDVQKMAEQLCSHWKDHSSKIHPRPKGKYEVIGYGITEDLSAPRNKCEELLEEDAVGFDFEACIDNLVASGQDVGAEPVQLIPPPPPCWSAEALNNCPVGGALRFAAPRYAMVGVPVTMYAYASWRPDANSPAQPTNGTAVIRVDGEDYSGVEFKDGVAEWRFIPETEGVKEFTASGVLFSGLSGANAYIDSVPARTYVLEYDPAAYAAALKKKAVEVGDTYVITDPNQARSYVKDRYEWSVSEKSDDVCAVYETKKGAVKAKFTDSGKCTVIWMDKESEESGKYTFIAKK